VSIDVVRFVFRWKKNGATAMRHSRTRQIVTTATSGYTQIGMSAEDADSNHGCASGLGGNACDAFSGASGFEDCGVTSFALIL